MIGNISTAPKAHTTQGGISRSTFDIAVQRKYKNSEGRYDADFFTVVAWRETADFCNRYLDKGRRVAVEGSLQVRSYTAQDGSRRWTTEIVAEHIETQDKPKDSQQDRPQQTAQDGFTEVEDDELPFD